MRFREISAGDALTQQFIAEMENQSPLLREFAEFYPIIGTSDYSRKASAATGGAVRALNSDFSDNVQTPAFANPSLKIIGDKIMVDQAHERRGQDIASVRARDLMHFAGYLGQYFNDRFINADGTGNEITGLKTAMPAGQKFYANSSSAALTVTVGNDNTAKSAQQNFLEKIDELVSKVRGGAGVIIGSPKTIARITSIARDYIQWTETSFGKKIPFYNGVPLLDIGRTAAGAEIIAGDETHGTISGTCYSLYAVRFGEGSDLSIATNLGLSVIDKGVVGSQYVHNAEFDAQLVNLDDTAIAVLQGFKLA